MDTPSTTRPAFSDESFGRLAGTCAFVVGLGGLAYSIAFVTLLRGAGRPAAFASGLFLLLSSLIATPVLVALYLRLRDAGPGLALWGLLVGMIAALGTAIHGGFDLAIVVNRPSGRLAGLPNPIDPRGLLTFGVAAIGTAVLAWLILRSGVMPRRLGLLGTGLAILLLVIYLGRLIILDPEHPLLLGAAAVAGFLANPAWWIWLGIELRRS